MVPWGIRAIEIEDPTLACWVEVVLRTTLFNYRGRGFEICFLIYVSVLLLSTLFILLILDSVVEDRDVN